MPLKLWLPLDGTSENRGISGVTMSGSPASWGNGRTGKCAVFNNNTGNYIVNTSKEFDYTVEDFSWAMWLKKDFASKTAGAMYAFSVGRPDAGGRGYGLAVYSSTQLRLWFGTKNYDLSNFPDNEWFHVAFTRKGNAIKIYKNGVMVSSQTFNGTLPTYSDGNGPGVGCFHYTGNIYPLIGAISDFRIYNHTLSAKEVYDLSRALIVHYPLSAPGNANPNLLTWTRNYTETSPFVWTSARADGSNYMGDDSLVTVTPGKDYYIQVKSTAIPGTHATGGTAVTNNFTIFLYQRNQGTSKAIGGYDSAPNLNKNNIFINDPNRQLYVWKWTAPSNAQDITLRTNSYSDGTTAVTLKFWDFKIEEDTYTSYVPSKNSAQYGELGYGTGTVRDATGRGNDSQLVVSEYSAGSPRYSSALNFSSPNVNYIWPIKDPINSATEEFTISMWIKPTDMSVDQFLWAGRTSGAHAVSIILQTTGKIHIDDSVRTTITAGITSNAWHHIVYTWKLGGNKVLYVNGVQKGSASAGTMDKSNTNACIGRKLTGATLESGNDFVGSISDVRVYGTALSIDDVKYLYETSAAIDNNGDMFADSFEETEMLPRVGKEGLVYGKNLSEAGGTVCAYTSTSKGNVDPNMSSWSYTPAADTDSSCMNGVYFERIEGIYNYRITLVVTWSGFTDISTTSTNFAATFQGITVKLDGSSVWSGGSNINSQLQAQGNLGTLAKGAASGTRLYDTSFTVPAAWDGTYKGQYVGIRTNYSNGTGKWTISKVRIYPADEHMEDTASLCASGAIQVRLADEVSLA